MILKAFLFLLSIYLAILFFLYVYQRQFIYFPSHFSPTPAEAGVPDMQVITLRTEDELNLKAWYRPPLKPQLPILVYFHGNAGNIGHRGMIIKPFLREGFGVLLVTYRGYSGNPGKPDEEGLYQDARAALQFLHLRGISNACLVLYGESIGTTVAMKMATEYCVGALILQSPFPSLSAIGQFHYPFFPVKWLIKDSFNAIEKIQHIQSPTLVLYGQDDDIIPPKFSIQLFEALPMPKEIKSLANTGHNDLFDSAFAINFIKKKEKAM